MKIHEQIKEARKAAGMTQKQAEKATGYTQTFISLLEAGKRDPSLEAMKVFCQAYDCQIIISK